MQTKVFISEWPILMNYCTADKFKSKQGFGNCAFPIFLLNTKASSERSTVKKTTVKNPEVCQGQEDMVIYYVYDIFCVICLVFTALRVFSSQNIEKKSFNICCLSKE